MSCPDANVIQAFADHARATDAREAGGAHLEECARCSMVLALAGSHPKAADAASPSRDRSAPDSAELLVDRQLGEFVLREKIGEGGFGAVYRAEQPALGREAVVKVLQRELRSRPDIVQRFLREAQLASKLDHPYAAHIYGFGVEPDGVLWIAMELVRGVALNSLLRMQGAMPIGRFAPLMERICEVVHEAHRKGIIHRDLKPANVMVMSRAGRLLPKLLDFGIAAKVMATDAITAAAARVRMADDFPDPMATTVPTPDRLETADTAPRTTPGKSQPPVSRVGETPQKRSPAELTTPGETIGSPAYMAPEQWRDGTSVDARADVYALGVMAFQCLTRRLPFNEQSTQAIAYAHTHGDIPRMGGDITDAVEAVVQKAMAKAPGDRYATALELGQALGAAAGLGPATTPVPELPEAEREQAMQRAPQPLAESVGALVAAHNVYQAREALWQVLHVAIRLVGLYALACRMRVGTGEASDSDLVSELLRQLRRRGLDDARWVSLAKELVRPFVRRRDAYPFPERIGLFFDADGDGEREHDAFAQLVTLRA